MASRFATVSKDEILAVNEATLPTNTKKKTKFALSMFTGRYENVFLLNLQQNHTKNDPQITVNCMALDKGQHSNQWIRHTLLYLSRHYFASDSNLPYLKFLKILNLSRKFIKYIDSSHCEIRPVNEFV